MLADDLLLLQTQRNDVLTVLLEEGVDASKLTWEKVASERAWESAAVSCLLHKGGNFRFVFDWQVTRERISEFSPGIDARTSTGKAKDWDEQLNHVRRWARALKRELNAPDLWAELKKLSLPSSVTPEIVQATKENAPFSAVEIKQIGTALDTIAEQIVEAEQIGQSERKEILAAIEHVRESSTRMGRKDWLAIFYGTFFALLVAKGVEPAALQFFWAHAVQAFGHVVRFLGP